MHRADVSERHRSLARRRLLPNRIPAAATAVPAASGPYSGSAAVANTPYDGPLEPSSPPRSSSSPFSSSRPSGYAAVVVTRLDLIGLVSLRPSLGALVLGRSGKLPGAPARVVAGAHSPRRRRSSDTWALSVVAGGEKERR